MALPNPTVPPTDAPPWLRWAIYFIGQVGFPIGVAAYLLGVFSQRVDTLIVAVNANSALIATLTERLPR